MIRFKENFSLQCWSRLGSMSYCFTVSRPIGSTFDIFWSRSWTTGSYWSERISTNMMFTTVFVSMGDMGGLIR